jgi:hypothetical protein
MILSKNFTLSEFTASATATEYNIDNTPNADQIENLRHLCLFVLEPLRTLAIRPIDISSGFRCDALNNKIGGTTASQHRCLENNAAVDFTIRGWSVPTAFKFIAANADNIPFDQAINEFNRWVHISYRRTRGNLLMAEKNGFRTVYLPV